MGKAAHQGRAVERLEFMKFAAVDDAGDDFARIIGRAHILWHDTIKFDRIMERRHGIT